MVRTRRSTVLGTLAAGLLLALAGCSAAPATPSPGPPTPLPPGALAVAASEYAFVPATATAPAGAVTFSVTNAGNENHEFEVLRGEESLGKIESFAPGTTRDLTLALSAGEYTLICKLNGHDILGMKAGLTVTGG